MQFKACLTGIFVLVNAQTDYDYPDYPPFMFLLEVGGTMTTQSSLQATLYECASEPSHYKKQSHPVQLQLNSTLVTISFIRSLTEKRRQKQNECRRAADHRFRIRRPRYDWSFCSHAYGCLVRQKPGAQGNFHLHL